MNFEFLKGAFDAAKKALATVEKEIDKLEKEREEARREMEELRWLPRPRDEAIGLMEELVDRWNEPFDKAAIEYIQTKAQLQRADIDIKPTTKLNPLGMTVRNPLGNGSPGKEELFLDADSVKLFSLMPIISPMVKSRLREVIQKMPWPERVGPPWPERQARKSELEKRICDLTEEIGAMLKHAREAGVDI
jgi:hypothetical protein